MRADPNSPTLFDDDLDDVARVRKVAWDHASRIAFIGRKGVHRAAIEGLSNALCRMCVPRNFNGEYWSPERQMHWLEDEAYRRCKELLQPWRWRHGSWKGSIHPHRRAIALRLGIAPAKGGETRPRARRASIVESSPLMRMGSVISAHAPLAKKRDAKKHRLSREIRLSRWLGGLRHARPALDSTRTVKCTLPTRENAKASQLGKVGPT